MAASIDLTGRIREELGIDVEIEEPFFSFSYTTDDAHTVGLVCPAALIGSAEDLVLNTETDHVVWAEEGELSRYLAEDDHNFHAAQTGFKRLNRTVSGA